MSSVTRPILSFFAIALVLSLSLPVPVEASHCSGFYRGAKIEWCWSPPGENVSHYFSFHIEAAFQSNGFDQVGDTFEETFFFGDGTSEEVTFTITEVHDVGVPELSWFLAKATILHHHYLFEPSFAWAGLSTCFRFGDAGSELLNNRNGAPFEVRTLVYVNGDELCSPDAVFPKIVWLSGGLGDTFEIPLAVEAGFLREPVYCRFATDAEAGGGPNPDGMTLDPVTCTITWTPTTGDPNRFWTTQVQAERYFSHGAFLVATTPIDFLLGLDEARPICVLQSTEPGPPARINVQAQDVRSGIARVEILEAVNTSVQVPPFTSGTLDPLTVVGTKINPAQGSRLRLRITDSAGNATECDPILTEVARETGRPESQSFGGVPPEERFVTVTNGNPGLSHLEIDVNGRRYRLTSLRPGEERTLDVGEAVREGQDSRFTLTPHGKPGGSAAVLIWDGRR